MLACYDLRSACVILIGAGRRGRIGGMKKGGTDERWDGEFGGEEKKAEGSSSRVSLRRVVSCIPSI
jgi:hypothetical protein